VGRDLGDVPGAGVIVFFTYRMSLATWADRGILERELQVYRPLLARVGGVTFVTYGEGDGVFEPRLDGIRVLPRPPRLRPAALSLLAPWIYRRHIRAAAVLKTNQASGAWTAVLAKWLHGTPLVVRCGFPWSFNYERESSSRVRRLAVRLLERLAVRAADRVVVTSEEGGDYLVARHGLDRRRLRVVPNAIDVERFAPAPAALRETGLIAYVGRLAPEKRLDVLVAAAATVPGARLLLIGDGPEREGLAQRAAAGGVPLELAGTVPNATLPRWLARAETFVLPSAYEGQPKALLEAMACGLPVVGSDVAGIREIVRHGETGWLAPAGDVGALAGALRTLSTDAVLRERLGLAGRAEVTRRHALEAVVERELAVLAEVMR
jgi:glycosyltransferase involved in cell wall biosynthesis